MKMANIPKIIGIIFLLLVFPLFELFMFSDVLLFSSTEELLSSIGNDDIPLTIDNDLLLLLILGKMDGTLLGDVDILGLTNTGLVELLLVLFAAYHLDHLWLVYHPLARDLLALDVVDLPLNLHPPIPALDRI